MIQLHHDGLSRPLEAPRLRVLSLADRHIPQAPTSACTYCPYRPNVEWEDMRDNAPEDFADAVACDHAWRHITPNGVGAAFIHQSRQPLDQVDFSAPTDPSGLLGFANDCEGMCGV